MESLSQIKRYMECVQGDKDFREASNTGEFSADQRAYLKEVGVMFEPEELSVLWEQPEAMIEVYQQMAEIDNYDDLSENVRTLIASSPILEIWMRYRTIRGGMYKKHAKAIPLLDFGDPRFNAWRKRRIMSTRSELGNYGHQIDHPSLAIELQVGCSVGCGFCAFDAPKLTKVFDYTAPGNKEFFEGIATVLTKLMGPVGASHALLYWSTEPHDNPNYIDFMKSYEKITGYSVCTATARSDERWIRDLIAYYRKFPAPWPRISVLSKKIMQKLHRQFTPYEFRDVGLLMQQSDAEVFREKVPGGRDKMMEKLKAGSDLRDMEEPNIDLVKVAQGSIACVSGFLINAITKTVMLSSPCYTSVTHRYGYRVFDQGTFETPEDLERVMRDMVERCMPLSPYPEMPMRFRDDFSFRAKEGGFDLVSPNQIHHFNDSPVWKPLGSLIDGGTLNYEALIDALVCDHGINLMIASAAVRNLFDGAFLDELGLDAKASNVLPSRSKQAMSA
ncbi:MAG: radical SAM family RiPP maturation amino acid epimerase [Magnetovibrio sp.]|nr:radical SAM family RiPP maturation amino acid epimerase [Magnetovibrio sp.]